MLLKVCASSFLLTSVAVGASCLDGSDSCTASPTHGSVLLQKGAMSAVGKVDAKGEVQGDQLFAGKLYKLSSSKSKYGDFEGHASLSVRSNGISSRVHIQGGSGAFASKTFNAHLHASPCGTNNGGAHYQNPNGNNKVDEDNENWPITKCDANSKCSGAASNDWVPTPGDPAAGLSIVVHDTPGDNSKAFCADLRLCDGSDAKKCVEQQVTQVFAGELHTLSRFTTVYGNFEGRASLSVTPEGISSEVYIRGGGGAFASKKFKAHLHASPCGTNNGGGHYQNPTGNGNVTSVNENWPITTCDANSICKGSASNTWVPTAVDLAAGLSIVLHDPNGGSKAFCADLRLAQLFTGKLKKLSSFTSNVYDGFEGRASLLVTSIGPPDAIGISSEVHIQGGNNGAFASKTFNAHLHALPCDPNNGGGHYQNPYGNFLVDADNENWPITTCDAYSICTGLASNTWVPTALDLAAGLSIVVHDPNGGSKAFCADLSPATYPTQ